MHFQKKLGLGFIAFGLLVILLAYLLTNGGGFVFSALLGLMAIFFGAFQLMLSKLALQTKTTRNHSASKTNRAKKARH